MLLFQSQLARRGDSALDHRMMIGAEYPHVIARRILRASGRAVSRRLVVQIHNTRLAANHTRARHIWVTKEESRGCRSPGWVFVLTIGVAGFRVAFVELLTELLDRYPGACIRTVLSPPVKAIDTGKDHPACTTRPFLIGRFVSMRTKIDFAVVQSFATLDRACSLIAALRNVGRSTLRTRPRVVMHARGLPLLQPRIVSGNEPIPVERRDFGAANRETAAAAAKRRGGVCVTHGSIIPQTRQGVHYE